MVTTNSWRSILLSTAAFLLAGGTSAFAQRSTGAYISRPTEQGPSSIIGRTGGTNTASYTYSTPQSSQSNRNYQSFSSQLTPRSNVAGMAGSYGGRGSFGIGMTRPGSMYNLRGQRYPFFPASLGVSSSSSLKNASGLEVATSYDQPLMGWESPRVEIPNTPYFVETSPNMTSVHQFFGLSPAPLDKPLPAVLQREGTYSAIVEDMNKASVEATARRAYELFKKGTTPKSPDRYEQLAMARGLFESVLQMDQTAYIPALLNMCAALEKDQFELGMRYLLDAVRRNPSLFHDKVDLKPYFGDPALLDEIARRMLRQGESAPESGPAWAMQGFSGWHLNDGPRLRDALQNLERLVRGNPTDKRLEEFRMALLAASE